MKKLWILLLGLLFALLLCGCTESAIDCGINRENQAYLRYDLSFDLSSLEEEDRLAVRGWLQNLAYRMKYKQGFSVDTNAAKDEELIRFRAELVRQGADRTEALSLLREMLEDETLTPFTRVSVEGETLETQELSRLRVRLEPDRVLETLDLETYPKQLREQVEGWLEAASVRLTLTLPATELPAGETASLENGLAVKQLTLPLKGSGNLSLSAVVYTGAEDYPELWWGGASRGAENTPALRGAIAADGAKLYRFERLLQYAAAALAGLALLLFVLGTVRARRRRKTAAAFPNGEAPADPPCFDETALPAFEETAAPTLSETALTKCEETDLSVFAEKEDLHPAEDSGIINSAGAPVGDDPQGPPSPSTENGGMFS